MVSTRGRQSVGGFFDPQNEHSVLSDAAPRTRKRRRSRSTKNEDVPSKLQKQGAPDSTSQANANPNALSRVHSSLEGENQIHGFHRLSQHLTNAAHIAIDSDPDTAQLASQLAQEISQARTDEEASNMTINEQTIDVGLFPHVCDAASLYPQGATLQVKVQSLPVLDNLVSSSVG